MKRWLGLAGLLAFGVSSIVLTAQQPAAPAGPDPANFTGTVTGHATSDIRISRYTFAPAARTNWHSHAGGQTIIVEQGRMRALEHGGAGKEFEPRETYSVAPIIVHWNGAQPDAPLTQVAVSFGVYDGVHV
jgi:quercetin dioxygenase-like cupin family protein